jgi:hypothetical protein
MIYETVVLPSEKWPEERQKIYFQKQIDKVDGSIKPQIALDC